MAELKNDFYKLVYTFKLNQMKKKVLTVLFLFLVITSFAQKQVYIPNFITSVNMDLNNCNSQWCHTRSIETDNIVVFWESGFGTDPSVAAAPYSVNVNTLLAVAEKSYATYLDSLKFAMKGASVTDRYKLMIFILYTTDWAAYGSGQDNLVGTLHVNPAAANINSVVAHEIGHCFQYITGCDSQGGYRYGFGLNASGGNGFWEQCAQWMSFKTYPAQQFSSGDFNEYVKNNHKHIIHETPRYANYFVHDYWTYKHGKDFMGRLWRESKRPEDPIESYKRLNAISQEQFNDEMYEHASRLTTWDLPAIKAYGANYIGSRAQVAMSLTTDNYWMVDSSVCIENYGYNSIKLNAPSTARVVTVHFRGKAGQSGFRALNITKGGWRYGFVALLNDGTRVYSDMGTAKVVNGATVEQILTFNCPVNCAKLWLVVSGSPQEHWKHAWDDNDSNDEQWPYQVQFENTDLLGKFSTPIHNETLTYDVLMDPMTTYTATSVSLNSSLISEAFAMSPDDMMKNLGTKIIYNGLNPDGSLNSTSTATAPGHWFSNTGQTVAWGASAYVFSELNITNLVANIGQYPSRCVPGQTYTIKQVLVYTKSATEIAKVTLIFNITIKSATVVSYTLATTVVGLGTVSPASGTFNAGTTQTLTATPATGYTFKGWSGDATGTINPLSVTMTANKNITATFTINVTTGVTNTTSVLVGNISPNPSAESFNIEFVSPTDIDIYSMDGKLVLSIKNVTSTAFGQELRSGLYIVKAGDAYYKIIKE
jgi:uncharacterized repeat protein (TIGR02543 family)